MQRLNRTSVGLKLATLLHYAFHYLSLNRTSVGLKLHVTLVAGFPLFWPQSNQRGIETVDINAPVQSEWEASIEPAWD